MKPRVDDTPLRAWLARLREDGEASFDLDAATQLPAFTSTVLGSGSLVLRWYDEDPWVLALEPDILPREAAALEVATGVADVPVPRLVAWSPTEPAALLMTRLPGSTEQLPPDVAALHDVLASIHAAPPGELARFHPYRGYHQGHAWPRPAWWRDRLTWERMTSRAAAGPPPEPAVVIHRDFHPDNVLWSNGRISGVVDWANACLGPAAVDVAHFRVNLAVLHGPATADAVLPGDPAWDLELAMGFLEWGPGADAWAGPWPELPADTARSRLEAFVARALAALG